MRSRDFLADEKHCVPSIVYPGDRLSSDFERARATTVAKESDRRGYNRDFIVRSRATAQGPKKRGQEVSSRVVNSKGGIRKRKTRWINRPIIASSRRNGFVLAQTRRSNLLSILIRRSTASRSLVCVLEETIGRISLQGNEELTPHIHTHTHTCAHIRNLSLISRKGKRAGALSSHARRNF